MPVPCPAIFVLFYHTSMLTAVCCILVRVAILSREWVYATKNVIDFDATTPPPHSNTGDRRFAFTLPFLALWFKTAWQVFPRKYNTRQLPICLAASGHWFNINLKRQASCQLVVPSFSFQQGCPSADWSPFSSCLILPANERVSGQVWLHQSFYSTEAFNNEQLLLAHIVFFKWTDTV